MGDLWVRYKVQVGIGSSDIIIMPPPVFNRDGLVVYSIKRECINSHCDAAAAATVLDCDRDWPDTEFCE